MFIFYICILVPLIQNGFSFEEVDLNFLSSYETLDQNFEIWNNEEENNLSRFEEICKNSTTTIYISEEDITFDCNLLKDKKTKYVGDRIKRSVDELEGSGEPEQEETITQIKTSNSPTITELETTKTLDLTKVTTNEFTVSEDEETNNFSEDSIKNEQTTIQKETTIKVETTTPPPKMQDLEKSVTHLPTLLVTEEKQKEAEAVTPKQSDKDEDPKKQVEKLESHKGKTLISLQETNEDNDKSIKTDESTQKAGTKDTTILVVLFVAVVVVGALAFAYNFIKKRKRQAADLERVEKGSIKRSLQNLTNPVNNEAEKKPLMDDNKEIEMVDMKKENIEVKVENGPSEVKVQS